LAPDIGTAASAKPKVTVVITAVAADTYNPTRVANRSDGVRVAGVVILFDATARPHVQRTGAAGHRRTTISGALLGPQGGAASEVVRLNTCVSVKWLLVGDPFACGLKESMAASALFEPKREPNQSISASRLLTQHGPIHICRPAPCRLRPAGPHRERRAWSGRFGFDHDEIRADLVAAGYAQGIAIDELEARSRAESCEIPAIAYCQGTPLRNEIESRDPSQLAHVTAVASAAVADRFGERDVDGLIRGFIVTADAP
jgi:hypothetical protein